MRYIDDEILEEIYTNFNKGKEGDREYGSDEAVNIKIRNYYESLLLNYKNIGLEEMALSMLKIKAEEVEYDWVKVNILEYLMRNEELMSFLKELKGYVNSKKIERRKYEEVAENIFWALYYLGGDIDKKINNKITRYNGPSHEKALEKGKEAISSSMVSVFKKLPRY